MNTLNKSDQGVFMPFPDIGVEMTSDKGIFTFDQPKDNPTNGLKYFVMVGGGYQGFKKKVNAKRFHNQD